jgi:hypothetical protein
MFPEIPFRSHDSTMTPTTVSMLPMTTKKVGHSARKKIAVVMPKKGAVAVNVADRVGPIRRLDSKDRN